VSELAKILETWLTFVPAVTMAKHVRAEHAKSKDAILEGIRTVIGDKGRNRRKLAY